MRKLEKAPVTAGKQAVDFLKSLMDKGLPELLSKINDADYYWDKVKHQKVPEGFTPEQIWMFEKARRHLQVSHIRLGDFHFLWNTNRSIHEALHFFDMHIGGTIGSGSLINKADQHRYLISSLMEEAIASSQIEGAVTTRQAAKEMLRKKRKPVNKSEQMILNNYLTIQKILEIKGEALDMDQLLAIHTGPLTYY